MNLDQVVTDLDDHQLSNWLVEYQLREIANDQVRQPTDKVVRRIANSCWVGLNGVATGFDRGNHR